ncbi:hypothetical protein V3W47_10610 [Deinococcus sp. YIM 134068]|uniref:hypothetical protein n=1 Tax=Deinococcus lichenicola TaxID=3118910 RepID=UPI002F91EE44
MRTTGDVIKAASAHLGGLSGHIFDVVAVSRPVSPEAAVNLAKIISKLSPLVGNLIEFNVVEFLNDREEFSSLGRWRRQDPGFPDMIFVDSGITPTPGFEVKAWFPLATEITARFKDSQNHFLDDQTYVVLLAWLPEHLIYGKPSIIDVCIVPGASVAAARDRHYHRPPEYLVLEPENTSARTRNLQQTNTNGFIFQGTPDQLEEARRLVGGWGTEGRRYQPTREYQELLRTLIARFPYRLDTNFAKIDRIVHPEIEDFKRRVYGTTVHNLKISQWGPLLRSTDDARLRRALETYLGVKDEDARELLK